MSAASLNTTPLNTASLNKALVGVRIVRVEGDATSRTDDMLAVEEPLEIRLGTRSLSITMRTPGNDFELAAGFLHSEGMIGNAGQILSMSHPDEGGGCIVEVELEGDPEAYLRPQRSFLMTSACGVCGKTSLQDLEVNSCPVLPPDEIRVSPQIVHGLPDALRHAQSVFDSTGGLHAAARFSLKGELDSVREDIGRHNAVDKLVGAALLAGRMPMSESLLLVSGRASFELVQKALVAGIPVMAAVGAPSSLAVATAERSGMTLIGFLRNGRFNVYTASHRIVGL